MKRSLAVLWSTLALVGLLFVGCNKDNGPTEGDDNTPPVGVNSEQTARIYFATNDEFVKNDEQTIADMTDPNSEPPLPEYGDGGLGKIDTGIVPIRWGRFVTRVDRIITETVYGDSIAIATVHKQIAGVLVIKGVLPGNDTTRVRKAFVDSSLRNIIFKRINRDARRWWLNWVPVATSLVKGYTTNPQNIDIRQVTLTSRGNTLTINNPLAFFLRYRWLQMFNQGDSDVPEFISRDSVAVRVTIHSLTPDTDLVALRYGFSPLHQRRLLMRLVTSAPDPNGGFVRVYQRTFPTHIYPGYFHIGFDAMTKETLFDKNAPYSVSWWGVPYRVY